MSSSLDRRALLRSLLAAPAAAALARCSPRRAAPAEASAPVSSGGWSLPQWPQPRGRASAAFNQRWGDGKAELIGYDAVTPRYGHLRRAELALVYVTEPFSRRTLIKDDDAQGADRMDVLKLNISEKFLTGVYPYSVLTSVFCPSDEYDRARFSPAKITLSAQEWCGHVFLGAWPDERSFALRGMSYFASEGDVDERVPCARGTLYEDALLVQLRELDGPFAEGRDWEGSLVPALWRNRRAHHPLRPEPARVRRTDLDADTTRFELVAGSFRKTFDVEKRGDKRVIAWQSSDGARARLLRSTRLPYWSLHDPGDERRRAEFGLDPTVAPAIDADGGSVGF